MQIVVCRQACEAKKMDKRRFRFSDLVISSGWFVAVSIVDALTTDRALRFAAVMTIGIACYAITPKPRAHPVIAMLALLALAVCWVNHDRIGSMTMQLFARWFSGGG